MAYYNAGERPAPSERRSSYQTRPQVEHSHSSSRRINADRPAYPSSSGYSYAQPSQPSHPTRPPTSFRPQSLYIPNPHSLSHTSNPPSVAPYLSNTRRKRTWPPPPEVRDEKVAYAAEHNPRTPDGDKEDVPYRGVINQDPLLYPVALECVPGFDPRNLPSSLDQPLGHEVVPNKRDSRFDAWETRSNTKDTRDDRVEDRSSDSEIQGVPLFSGRKSTPYLYNPPVTKERAKSRPPSMVTAESQPTLASKRQSQYGHESFGLPGVFKPSGTQRDDRKYQLGDPDIFSSYDIPSTPSRSRDSSRYSLARSDVRESELRSSLQEAIGKRPVSAVPKAFSNPALQNYFTPETNRSRPHSADDTPPVKKSALKPLTPMNAQNLPSPSVTPESRVVGTAHRSHVVDEKELSTRPSSPSTPSSSYPPSPPRSPHLSGYNYSKTNSPQSGLSTQPGSRPVSRPASPANEYTGISMPTARYEVLQDRSRPHSRLASTTFPPTEPLDPYRPVLNIFAPSSLSAVTSLPYPDEDAGLTSSIHYQTQPIPTANALQIPASMPSEDDHTYKNPYFPQRSRGVTSETRPLSMSSSIPQSSISTRQIIDGQFPVFPNTKLVGSPVAMTSTELQQLSNFNAPTDVRTCRKLLNSDDHDDWYMVKLKNVNTLYMCPECFNSLVQPNALKRNFQPVGRQALPSRARCDFSSTWMRMALLLDKGESVAVDHRKSSSPNKMYHVHQLARLAAVEQPCPGESIEVRDWYTVYDERRKAIDRFDVCPYDVARFEILLPNLRGTFQRNPATSGHKRKCDLRISSQRFIEYFDMLGRISERTHPGQRSDMRDRDGRLRPDIQPFVEFVRAKAKIRECTWDKLLYEVDWFFPPALPELTVCPECYTAVVWPAIHDGSAVASKFARHAHAVPGERSTGSISAKTSTPPGRSCQLYSPRMRKVFKKAVARESFEYLARKAIERREVELELTQEREGILRQKAEVEKALAALGSGGGGGGSEGPGVELMRKRAALVEQLEDCDEYWAKWE